MLTDDDARRLLHRAGETVTVDPAAPMAGTPPRRRGWPVLAAAAAVVLVAVAAVLVTDPATQDPEPAPSPSPSPSPPAVAGVQVPSVLGYDLDDALTTLRDAGLTTRVERVASCVSDHALGTEPAAGTPVPPGSEVVVEKAVPSLSFCPGQDQLALDLLAFADGRGPVPPLAPTVFLYDGLGNQVALTAKQAARRGAWRVCAVDDTCTWILDELSDAAHRPYPIGVEGTTSYLHPVLTTRPDGACDFEPGARGYGRPAATIGVMLLVDGVFCTQEFVVDVHTDAGGRITAVGLSERVPG